MAGGRIGPNAITRMAEAMRHSIGDARTHAVFATAEQRAAAVASRDAAMRVLGKSFTTPVVGAQRFWPAGAEHQDYARRNRAHYEAYRQGCRRPQQLRAIWGDAAVG